MFSAPIGDAHLSLESTGTEDGVLRAAIASQRESTTINVRGRTAPPELHRRVTPWRELTSYFLLRPGGRVS